MITPTEVLCRDLPDEFKFYLDYTHALGFEDKPNYTHLKQVFRGLFIREGFQYDNSFDWYVNQYEKSS